MQYQLLNIGVPNELQSQVIRVLAEKVEELGLPESVVKYLDSNNWQERQLRSPLVAVYYGGATDDFPDLDVLAELNSIGAFVMPVVEDLTKFNQLTPAVLHPINGFALNDEGGVNDLVNRLLENLGLLRMERRLFISYKRRNSSAVALQLYEALDAQGFDVFLDTHSVPKGANFQDELWQRMADSDIVILLNTEDFLGSKWTEAELIKASSLSIAVIEVVWPEQKRLQAAGLFFPIYLKPEVFASEFGKSSSLLVVEKITEIIQQVESLRARSLAARQDNIIREFISAAKTYGVNVLLHPERFMTFKNKDGEVLIIPTIGTPHAFIYYNSAELFKKVNDGRIKKAVILYDERNTMEKWRKHLEWLDEFLPVKTVKITKVHSFIQNDLI